jgi:DNA-binding SARP family transcriptional activator
MRFRVLGPLQVLSSEGWQTIGARKWRSLLATLLLHPGRTVSVDTLTDAIWGDEPPAKAANLVSIYVLRLRRLLGDPDGQLLVTRAPGYFIRAEPDDVDVARFEELADEGRRTLAVDPERAAALLGEALQLWTGEALADVPPSPYIEAETERLSELRLATVELRIEAELECERFAQVIPELRGTLAGNPLRERLWLLLMRALEGDGRHAEALDAYAQAREAIADQLGVDPSVELRRLHQELLNADDGPDVRERPRRRSAGPSRGRSAAPPPEPAPIPAPHLGPGSAQEPVPSSVSPSAGDDPSAESAPGPRLRSEPVEPLVPTGSVAVGTVPALVPERDTPWLSVSSPAQLPADIGDFTGRTGLVDHMCAMLAARQGDNPGAVQVVVVAGSGGLGKTSLAIHAAHRLRRQYQDGQLYVDLLGATSQPQAPADVLARFLRDLGVESSQVPADAEERSALFRTRLAGRRVLLLLDNARDAAQVRSLLPGSATCAVIVTARSRMPDLASTQLVDLEVLDDDESLTLFTKIVGEKRAAAEPESTAEVLVACAGLPLAIRICAARLAARSRWSIQTLAERLRARLLDELRTGDMAVRASFQVSFDSLPRAGSPARAFRLLGLWQGPFVGLSAAAALLGRTEDETAEALEILVDACLLESPAPDQYRFHDLLRVYAAERARADEDPKDREAAINRVLEWYLHSVDAAAHVMSPHRTPTPLPAAPQELRAVEFASADDALDWLEDERGNLIAATRQAADDGRDDIAWLLPVSALTFFIRRGYFSDWIASHEMALTSVRKLGDAKGEARVLTNLGEVHSKLDLDLATRYLERALDIHRASGDLRGEAHTTSNLLYVYVYWGRYDAAVAMRDAALESQRRAGSLNGEGIVLSNIAEAYVGLGQIEDAIACLQPAQEIFGKTGDVRVQANVLQNLGDAYVAQGRSADGIDSLRGAVDAFHALRDRPGEALALLHLGKACNKGGRYEDARTFLNRADSLFRVLGDEAQAEAVRGELAALAEAEDNS